MRRLKYWHLLIDYQIIEKSDNALLIRLFLGLAAFLLLRLVGVTVEMDSPIWHTTNAPLG
ncbi:hypothetical protein PMIT1323_01286 [Prochlorococcus marinus str. MIT 1323]|nr:hypothetical protein PMIT1323_01286 [Prochlorococcus marinus str. MIT 1323]